MKKITIPNGKKDKVSKGWFNQGFANLMIYVRDHISIDISADYMMENGYSLGKWIKEVREYWQEDKLTHKQQYLLENIGLSKDEQIQNWESVYCSAKNYYYKYGTLPESISYYTDDGILLGAWIEKQKRFGYMLSDEQRRKLKEIGIKV